MTRLEAHKKYKQAMDEAARCNCLPTMIRTLTLQDPFFRLCYVLTIVPRHVIDCDWVYDRCREVQKDPWGHVDLWAREHFKTTVITQNGMIGDVLNNPESTTCVFSFNRPTAKKLVWPVIQELENNTRLKQLFPEILYQDPRKESPKWSADDGYIVKRKSTRKEPTIMSSGLVDGQPTGMHFEYRRYDDVETVETVRSPEVLDKTYDALRISYNCGITNGGYQSFVGTIYGFNDIYIRLIRDGVAKERKYTATQNNELDGEPWIWTRRQLADKIRDMGPYVASCQLFLNPTQDGAQRFLPEWLRYWRADRTNNLTKYILCDPANEKKTSSDYTVFMVVGLGSDHNYYIIRMIRDRMSLQERANVLFKLHQDYKPRSVGYEKYGMQADISYFNERMDRDNYRFGIIELGGQMPKNDRIKRLMPLFAEGRIYIPDAMPYEQLDRTTVDLTRVFINDEYNVFPYPVHDDMLDCLARIVDPVMSAVFPQGHEVDVFDIRKPVDESEDYDIARYGIFSP